MPRQGKAQRPIYCPADSNTRRHHHLVNRIAVIPHLERRIWINQIDAVVRRASESQRLAKPAGS